jgi:hypothetical protein
MGALLWQVMTVYLPLTSADLAAFQRLQRTHWLPPVRIVLDY